MKIRWCGFDWGETLADPSVGYSYTRKLVTEILENEGKSESNIVEKLKIFDELVENSTYEPELTNGMTTGKEFWIRHFKFKNLQDRNIKTFYSQVLDNDQKAIELYNSNRFGFFEFADGIEECLRSLKNKKISVNIVSEIGSTEFLKFVPNLLASKKILSYFTNIVTNKGSLRINGQVDLSYDGKLKTDGLLYKKLSEDLLKQGIPASEAAIIGDRPFQDIEMSKKYGFRAIQYVGIVKRQISPLADYVISDLRQLSNIID
jgi:phosphoglycolate phosphatase-like HAD superfamily hydrolase